MALLGAAAAAKAAGMLVTIPNPELRKRFEEEETQKAKRAARDAEQARRRRQDRISPNRAWDRATYRSYWRSRARRAAGRWDGITDAGLRRIAKKLAR